MSQLTFDGFVPEGPAIGPPVEIPVVGTRADWYKGRVLSHSSVSLYRACPQKWKFRYIDKVPEKPKSFFSFGKSVHAALEFLFNGFPTTLPTLEEVLSDYKAHWIREGYETPALEKWFFQEGDRILKGFYAKHARDLKNVLKVEYRFSLHVEGIPMLGYVDRIDTTANGGLAVIDYKTGKAFDKSRARVDPQLTLYQIACKELFQKPVETLTLYHLNSLTPITVPAHSTDLEEKMKSGLLEAAHGITDQKFDPKPDERGQCQWCDYMQICPAFSKRKPMSENHGSSPAMAEAADRYGKLEARIKQLTEERDQLGDEIMSHLEVTGKSSVEGKHFSIHPGSKEEGNSSLEIKPISKDPLL